MVHLDNLSPSPLSQAALTALRTAVHRLGCDCKQAQGQKAGAGCAPKGHACPAAEADILTASGKCVWAMSWSILVQIGWGTLLGFVGRKQQRKKCQSGKSQSVRNEKGPGREDKSLPWHEGVREPIKGYREQGQHPSDRLRELFLLPNSYHDMKWTWTRNLLMRCSSSLFVLWLNWSA